MWLQVVKLNQSVIYGHKNLNCLNQQRNKKIGKQIMKV